MERLFWPGAIRQDALRLGPLLGLLAALLVLAAQAPLSYRIEIGQEDGPGADLPLILDFNTPEHDFNGDFRWTAGDSIIRLPGVGQRPLLAELRTFPVSQEMAQNGPQTFTLVASGQALVEAPVRPNGGVYHFLLPPPPDGTGDQQIELVSTTVIPSGDVRSLGILVDAFRVTGAPGPTVPAWGTLLAWLGALCLAWLAIRSIGITPALAIWLLLPGALLLGLAALLDPPRLALGGPPALITLALTLALALVMRYVLGRYQTLFGQHTGALQVLCLIMLLVFAMRYGGKIYPYSMPGDIGFHINRFADTLRGQVFLLSRNRGVDFPYPPAFYLVLAPLTLAGIERGTLLQVVGAVLDALSPLLVYGIAIRSGLIRDRRFAVFAAALYSLSGAGFMPTWWNFSTHIFSQFTHLLLLATLVFAWPQHNAPDSSIKRPWLWGLVFVQCLVYLGHFGFWINTTLVAGFGLAVLALAARREQRWWRLWRQLVFALVVAELSTVLFFYSGYSALIIEQVRLTMSGGLNELAGRAPVSREIVWNTLHTGLYAHIGLFPLPMALCGLLVCWRSRNPGGTAHTLSITLMAGTFVLGVGFAVLPFLTGSTLSTRWLMFSIWAIAIGAAVCAEGLWHTGRVGRLIVIAIGAYVFWGSASMWLLALAWRVRPPEPF